MSLIVRDWRTVGKLWQPAVGYRFTHIFPSNQAGDICLIFVHFLVSIHPTFQQLTRTAISLSKRRPVASLQQRVRYDGQGPVELVLCTFSPKRNRSNLCTGSFYPSVRAFAMAAQEERS